MASGSDDKSVLVYRQDASTGVPLRAAFGSNEPPPVENWKVCQTLKGHTADITDLAWCPLGEHLASTSVDNTAQVHRGIATRAIGDVLSSQDCKRVNRSTMALLNCMRFRLESLQ